MSTPADKDPAISRLLDKLANRTEAITSNRCVNPPMGCAGLATEFRDTLSEKEYSLTGFCQSCQDKLYGV